MKTSCLLVDDEPIALRVLQSHLAKIPTLEVVASCGHAMEAFRVLYEKKVDLLFLDIHMPGLSGIEFLKSLRQTPKVILTTAHREYALEGYELDIVDYLLKPISLERLLKAVDKYYKSTPTQILANSPFLNPLSQDQQDYVYIKSERKMRKLYYKDIFFIESIKDYVKIHTGSEVVVTKQAISHFEESLPKEQFIRIHRAYLIAKSHIKVITANTIEVASHELPIGRSYKNSILLLLNYPSNK